jgi:hypothetical protein
MSGPQLPTYREIVTLPVGFKDPASDDIIREAEVRPVTGADELYIGMSPEYNRMPNDLVYKMLLLSRTVTKLGDHKPVTVNDVSKLHAMDVRALEYAVYRLTYGEDALPDEDPNQPGG